ncbi:sigma 54-interacting transcriptional regulator [Klebsiella sp. NPDC088457]
MTRKKRILTYLADLCKKIPGGTTTQQISETLKISRPNVSSDLNMLVKEGVISKSNTRPVYYFVNTELISEKVSSPAIDDPFTYLIGYHDSLQKQISQAKAAIIYPPHGLHTLLTGETGTGKSLFARLMYNYAIARRLLKEQAPFIVFNCADYASNPQLLVSHIFGHAKGTFTGADKDKPGLLSEADGGMLFLDEVHRLPPEGQEMIFYFIDTGTWGQLGETKRDRRAEILLICATTEDPSSSLLSTFLRRIPITINLPGLANRLPEEQVELLKFLLKIEAARIGCTITIDADSAKSILGSSFAGNVGKLKSTIQSVCAHFFVEKHQQQQMLDIRFEQLALDIKTGIFNLKRNNDYLARLQYSLGDIMTILPDAIPAHPALSINKNDSPLRMYDFIDNKINFMLEQNFTDSDINRFITSEINNYIDVKLPRMRQWFDHGLDKKMLLFCQSLKTEIELQMGKEFGDNFLFSLGYHLTNLTRNHTHSPGNSWIRRYRVNKLPEYDSALTIKKRLQDEFSIDIHEDEVAYLTILLSSLVIREKEKLIHVIVATHGDFIASNMVDIARTLIAEENISAVNMPLNIRPNQAIAQIKETILATPNARGFLLLVDMGSLLHAGDIIAQECRIAMRTLDMVSTPLVIEALRRTSILNVELDDIYFSLLHFKGYGANQHREQPVPDKPLAVLAICSSGEGIAKKLQSLLRSVLDEINRSDIHIINLSADEMFSRRQSLLSEYQVLLSVGIVDPEFNLPHIPLAEFFSRQGELKFQTVIGSSYVRQNRADNPVTLTKLSEQYLQDFVVFLNPKKAVPIVMSFIQVIKEHRRLEDQGSGLLNICVHICLALERSVRNETITYNKQNREEYLSSPVMAIYQTANDMLENKTGVKLSDDELLYIMDMLEDK